MIGAVSGGGVIPGAIGMATSTGALVVSGTTCAGCRDVEEGAGGVATGIGVGVAGGGKGTLGATACKGGTLVPVGVVGPVADRVHQPRLELLLVASLQWVR